MAPKRQHKQRVEADLDRCTALPIGYVTAVRNARSGERLALEGFGCSMRAKAPTLDELDRR